MNDMRKLMEKIEQINESKITSLTPKMAKQLVAIPFPKGLSTDSFFDYDEHETGGVDQIIYEEGGQAYLIALRKDAKHMAANLQRAADYFGDDDEFDENLDEVALRRDDEDWDDYSDERTEPDQEMKDAPYYVEWNAQSWEWYGDDDPSTGKGRYKPKGDGGRVVAINVPTFAQAQKIADKLDSDYEDGSFEDKNVYGTQGEDGYVLDYHGSNIRSMAKMDEYTERELKHVHPNFQPKDYSG